MKRACFTLSFALLLVLPILGGCELTGPESSDQNNLLDSGSATASLPFDRDVHVEGTDVTLRFTNLVSESRCPSNVVCIWAGEAIVEVRVTRDGIRPTTTRLTLPGGSSPTDDESLKPVEVSGIRFTLTELSPYPDTNEHPESDYVATVRLEKAAK